MDQALNSQKTPHTSPLRASYGMSFVSILMKNDRVIKGFYCTHIVPNRWHAIAWTNDGKGSMAPHGVTRPQRVNPWNAQIYGEISPAILTLGRYDNIGKFFTI